MTGPLAKEGDRVVVDGSRFSGVWIVIKVNPTKYVLEPEGGGRQLTAPHDLVRPAPVNGLPMEHDYQPGEIVKWDSPKSEGKLFVVLGVTGNRVNIVCLGGDHGRQWTVSTVELTLVPTDEVLKQR